MSQITQLWPETYTTSGQILTTLENSNKIVGLQINIFTKLTRRHYRQTGTPVYK